VSQPAPTCQILSALGLTALTDLFLMTTHDPKTHLTSQQPALLIRPASRCGLLQFIHLMEPNDLINTTGQPVRSALILNVTAWPNQPDIIRFGSYRPHEFVLGDHAWPQNASDKSITNTTNKARDQIFTRQCRLLHRV
jgi:hypothetical protein